MKKILLFCFFIVTQMSAMLIQDLSRDINCAILNQVPFFSSPQEIGMAVSSLAQIDKSLNLWINARDNTLDLIKKISKRFNLSDLETTMVLRTRGAIECCAIQITAIANWRCGGECTRRNLNQFRKILDVNFTYDSKILAQPTILLTAASWQEYGYADVGKWFIENGADINILSKDNRNASMLALYCFNTDLAPLLINHSQFKIHHQDNDGNTPLHCCFGVGIFNTHNLYNIDVRRCKLMCSIVEQLLQMGADPLFKNNEGETPFSLAKATKYDPFMEIFAKYMK